MEGLEHVMSENAPEYDPQANGSAEVGVQRWKGQFKSLRSGLEEEIGYRVPARHPVIAWLAQNSADVKIEPRSGRRGRHHTTKSEASHFRRV